MNFLYHREVLFEPYEVQSANYFLSFAAIVRVLDVIQSHFDQFTQIARLPVTPASVAVYFS